MRIMSRSPSPNLPWLSYLLSLLIASLLVAGCTSPPVETEEGVRLVDRKECDGTFADGVPVHCEQEGQEAILHDEPPFGWVVTYGPRGEHDSTFYRSVDPSDPPGMFRLGYSYEIQRGAIDPEISLDPIHGLAWQEDWERAVFWESGKNAFVEFPEPVAQGDAFDVILLHPHTIALDTGLFNVSVETPELHDKTLEPLWAVHDDETRVVHRVHGDEGPYYFHAGQPDTGVLGDSISQEGVDYSIISRLIVIEQMPFSYTP